MVEQGRDPTAAKQEARAQAAAAAADTLQAVCEEYFKRDGAKLRSRDQQEAALARHVYKLLGNRQIHGISRKEIIRLLDAIEDKSGPRTADLTLAYLAKIMNWHAVRDETFRTPIVRGMTRQKASERARSRILNDDELRAVWAASAAPGPFAAMVRFLLLTAARRREASHMEWSEIQNNGDWLLPAARNKTKVELCRPLSSAAQAVLAEQPTKRIVDCKYVFGNDGVRPLSSYTTGKRRFDAACGVTGWTIHDLRRTARSLMARAGVNSDVAERTLGHVISGVRGVYDRHTYQTEMRDAYERLAQLLERIVNPQANVVAMPKR